MTPTNEWAAALPPISERRLAVRVTADAQRRLRAGHPWLFDGSITDQSGPGAPGDLAVVFDAKRAFLAIGLYDPDSPIRVRILHTGAPTPIDNRFWQARIDAAVALRAPLEPSTTGYRLINGENDGLGAMIVDRYASVLVVKLYSAAWFPHLPALVELLGAIPGITGVVLRLARNVASGRTFGLRDGTVLAGEVTDPVLFEENGLVFEAATRSGQKTGHFLDQRDNRRRVGERSYGKSVLDVFACTGGFAVHAAAGRASSVHLVDLNPQALDAARRNLERNPTATTPSAVFTVGDAFTVLERLVHERRFFDVVVVDPPSFAKRQDQVVGALRAYRRLTDLAVRLVEADGWLVQASCSSRIDAPTFVDTVTEVASGAGRPFREVEVTGHGIDHPVTFAEGTYLKAVFARL